MASFDARNKQNKRNRIVVYVVLAHDSLEELLTSVNM